MPPEDAAQALIEDATLTEKATVEAAEYLQRSGLEGAAKVTNVKVTTDEREVIRRHVCAAAALGYLIFKIYVSLHNTQYRVCVKGLTLTSVLSPN